VPKSERARHVGGQQGQ